MENEIKIIENPLSGIDDPEKLKLPWTIKEEPGECWFNMAGVAGGKNVLAHYVNGKLVDAYGFFLDEKGNQIPEADGY